MPTKGGLARTFDSDFYNHRSGSSSGPVLFRRGLLLPFFIKPKLQLVPNIPCLIVEPQFLTTTEGKIRKLCIVSIRLFNNSKNSALNPYFVMQDTESSSKGLKFAPVAIFSRRFDQFKEFRIPPLPDAPGISSDDALAQLIIRNWSSEVRKVPMLNSEMFTIGFTFENGTHFYYFNKGEFVGAPVGSSRTVFLGAGAEGVKVGLLEKGTCQIHFDAWDKVRITNGKGVEL